MKRKTIFAFIMAFVMTVLVTATLFAKESNKELKKEIGNIIKYSANESAAKNLQERPPIVLLPFVFVNAIDQKDVTTFDQIYKITSKQFGDGILKEILNISFKHFKYIGNKSTPFSQAVIEEDFDMFVKIYNSTDDAYKQKFLNQTFNDFEIISKDRDYINAALLKENEDKKPEIEVETPKSQERQNSENRKIFESWGGSNQIFLQWVFANAIYEKDFISFEQLYNITLNQFGEEILESVLNGAFAGIKCAANSKTLTPLLVTMCHKYASGFMVIWNAIDDKEKSKFLQESFKKVKITREERKLTGALSNILL